MNDENHATMPHPYQPNLSFVELVDELRALLTRQRQIEALICRYLADLADRIQANLEVQPIFAYTDVYQAAESLLGLGIRSTRERVRVGRALRQLPRVEAAFERGDVGYTRVREITRVARVETEAEWLELGRTLPMRQLERRVALAGGRRGERKKDEPARAEWATPETVRVALHLPAETWALVERAMEIVRQRTEGPLTDAEALAAVAGEAIGGSGAMATQESTTNEPSRMVVLYECHTCRRTELETGGSAVEVTEAAATTLGCGMPVRDLRTEGRLVSRGGPLPAAVRRAVLLRDRCRCRVPGCNRRRYVDVHHVHSRDSGATHSRHHCVTLCSTHHRMLHDGELIVEGDAEGELDFRDSDGQPVTKAWASPTSHKGVAIDSTHTQAEAEHDAVTQAGARPARLTRPGAVHDGVNQADAVNDAVTQAGAEHDAVTQAGAEPDWPLDDAAMRLLRVMGGRGGWRADDLCDASGLGAGTVQSALLALELSGRVHGGPLTGYRAA